VPGGGPFGISGVQSGNAAPFVGGPPGVELHSVVNELPSRDAGETVPVVLPMSAAMVPSAAEADKVDTVGDRQVTTVPGVVGLEASGNGASVVSGALTTSRTRHEEIAPFGAGLFLRTTLPVQLSESEQY
jgi:hypothetical protein